MEAALTADAGTGAAASRVLQFRNVASGTSGPTLNARLRTPVSRGRSAGLPLVLRRRSKPVQIETTLCGGSLGSCVDEERSKMR